MFEISQAEIDYQIECIKNELAKHDFSYEMSDDHKEWRSGQAHKETILRMMRRIPVNRLPAIMKTIPEEFRMSWAMCLALNGDKK